MGIIVRLIATTTTVTWFNDPYDRVIATLNLTGKGKTFFDFTNLRVPQHMARLAGFGPKRPQRIDNSLTTVELFFAYVFHFGVAPFKVNPRTGMLEDNPWDLTAGIPPTESGNLTLGGSFAADSAMGTNATITDADLEIYLWGVQPEAGDPYSAFMPKAIPVWQMNTPTAVATSGLFATAYNIPSGDFLHSLLWMTTRQANTPRDDGVLSSIEVFNQLENRSILRYGGLSSNVLGVQGAELLSQFGQRLHLPYSPLDNVTTAMDGIGSGGTTATPTVAGPGKDSGLIYFPLHQYALGSAYPDYGVDMRGVASGDLQVRRGVITVTTITEDVLLRKYQLLT